MQRSGPALVPFGIAVVAGVLAWDLVRLIGTRREAWDDPNYWIVGYPLMLGTAFLLGLGFPERPWRWAAAIVGAQALWSLFLAASIGDTSLFPLGLLTFAALAVPCIAAAYTGRWMNRRLAG